MKTAPIELNSLENQYLGACSAAVLAALGRDVPTSLAAVQDAKRLVGEIGEAGVHAMAGKFLDHMDKIDPITDPATKAVLDQVRAELGL